MISVYISPGVDIWKLGERFSSQNVHEFPEADKVDQDRWGVIPRAMQEIFRYVTSNRDRTIKVWCAYLEIYNEHVRDLLRVGREPGDSDGCLSELEIREDKVATPLPIPPRACHTPSCAYT